MSVYKIHNNDEDNIFDELIRQNILNNNNNEEITNKNDINYVSKNDVFIEQYIVLDSFSKIKESNITSGEYQWMFNTQGQSMNESIGVLYDLDNIVEIQMGSFYMPLIEDNIYIDTSIIAYGEVDLIQNNTSDLNVAPTLVRKNNPRVLGQYPYVIFTEETETYKIPWINNPYTQLPYCNRICIYIKETGLQSYINPNNTRFNFEFSATYDTRLHNNPNFLQVNPSGSKWDSYVFINPLKDLKKLTLSFSNPDIPISFVPDIMYYSVINLTDDQNGGKHITIFTQVEHKLLAGDRVFLYNFIPINSDNSLNIKFPQYLLNYILRPVGHVVNVAVPGIINPVDPATPIGGISFCLDPSIKLLDPIDPIITGSFPGLVDVYIAKRRLRIPIKIKSIKK